jgi:hypothetical protein
LRHQIASCSSPLPLGRGIYFQKTFSPRESASGAKTKAAEALGFRGTSSALSHSWGHSLGNLWPSDFKGEPKTFSKTFSNASNPAQK